MRAGGGSSRVAAGNDTTGNDTRSGAGESGAWDSGGGVRSSGLVLVLPPLPCSQYRPAGLTGGQNLQQACQQPWSVRMP